MRKDSTDFPGSEGSEKPGFLKQLLSQARRVWLIPAGLLVAFFAVLLYNSLFPDPLLPTQRQIDENIMSVMASATPPAAYSAQVYQAILPSLVLIQTQVENPHSDATRGVGSGVVINANGDILTALHVVQDSLDIEVNFADGTKASAEVIAAEPDNDIAVLHPLQPPGLIVPAVLGNPNAMRIGDEAFAVGNPLGLTGSMSAGVISGFDRSVPLNDNGRRLEGLIQFDAAVNPGNSGGPLLNRYGQVVGIVTALANPSRQESFTGIGFAVPITTAGGAAGLPPY